MIEIKVNKSNVKAKGEGNPIELIAELGMIVENMVEEIIKGCPDDFRDFMKDTIKDTINFAVDEAFN